MSNIGVRKCNVLGYEIASDLILPKFNGKLVTLSRVIDDSKVAIVVFLRHLG